MVLYVYCAGGFGKEVMDVARRVNARDGHWDEIYFIDDSVAESERYGASVLRFDQVVQSGGVADAQFVIANGEPEVRRKIVAKLDGQNANLGRVIDINSVVVGSACLEPGVVVTPLCSISSDAYVGRNVCVNTMSIIGHDVRVEMNAVISSKVNLGGACVVGQGSYIGMGAMIKEGVRIGANSIVGMGSVVYNDVPDNMIALGNPARVMRPNTDKKVFK